MTDLNQLIEEVRQRENAQKQAAEAALAAAQAQLRETEIAKFNALMLAALDADLLTALQPTVEARLHFKMVYVNMRWRDDESATLWELEGASTTEYTNLTLKAVTADNRRKSMLDWQPNLATLRERLLVGIGFVRETVADARAKAEAHRQRCEREAVEMEQARLQREQQDAEACAIADKVHLEIESLIAERFAEEQAKLWQWKPGATITLYTVRYCTGAFPTEDGTEFDYTTGLTLADTLDADGYRASTLMSDTAVPKW